MMEDARTTVEGGEAFDCLMCAGCPTLPLLFSFCSKVIVTVFCLVSCFLLWAHLPVFVFFSFILIHLVFIFCERHGDKGGPDSLAQRNYLALIVLCVSALCIFATSSQLHCRHANKHEEVAHRCADSRFLVRSMPSSCWWQAANIL